MNKETVEKVAVERCTTDTMEEWKKDFGTFCFMDGARWRINSVWHKANKEMPIPFRPILVEHDDGRFSVNMVGGNMRSCRLVWARWAYISDLLPDVTEDEKCCGSCRHFSNEDINGNGWCSANECETTCGQTCENWREKQSFKPE